MEVENWPKPAKPGFLKKLIVPAVLLRKIYKGLNIPNNSFTAADEFKF